MVFKLRCRRWSDSLYPLTETTLGESDMWFSRFTKKPPVPEAVQEAAHEQTHDEPSTRASVRRTRRMQLPASRPTPAQAKSEANKARVLILLGRHGIVDAQLTAMCAFGEYSQAYEMARRTLQLLLKDRCVARRRGVHGSDVFVLTDAGAEHASKILGREVQGGMHLRTPTSPTLLHRLLGSYHLFHYASYLHQEGIEYEYLTERELEQRRGGTFIDSKSIIGKRRPDALIVEATEHGREAIWIEVERGYKIFQRFEEQLSSLIPMIDKNIAPYQMPRLILREIHYVADPDVVDLIHLGASIRKIAKDRQGLLDKIMVFRANIRRPYWVEDLSGITASNIPKSALDKGYFESADLALKQWFTSGFFICGRPTHGK